MGFRWWDSDGQLGLEYGIQNGVKHGIEYDFYDDEHLAALEPVHHGKYHGTAKQWSYEGELLITYSMVHGTGVDLWCCNFTGTLSEETHYQDNGVHGFLRRWNEDEKTIWLEEHVFAGKGYHGILRQWNDQGKLKRGYPQYYVNDTKVTKRQYLQAAQSDPTLPPFRVEENQPFRSLPPEYLAQRNG